MFDLSDSESFENVKMWLKEIAKYATENVHKILVGNKCDKRDTREVAYEDAKEFAERNSMHYLESSAKTNINVEKIFITLAREVLDDMKKNGSADETNHTTRSMSSKSTESSGASKKIELTEKNTSKPAKSGCCGR